MTLRRMSLVVLLFSLLLALPAEGARRVAILDLENQSGGSLKEVPGETKEKIERHAAKTFDAYALYRKGREAHDQNLWDEAIALHRQALALDPDYADAWIDLGVVLRKRGRFDEAEEAGRRALSIFTKRGDEEGTGEVLNNLGNVTNERGRFDEAEGLYQESLAIKRRIGNEPGVAATLNNLGEVARKQGRYDEAERLYQESLGIFRRLGDEPGIAQTLNNLGIVADNRGRTDEAERLYQEGLAIKRRIGDEPGVAGTLFNLALLADNQGSKGQAIRYAREALEIFRRIGNPYATRAEDLLSKLGDR